MTIPTPKQRVQTTKDLIKFVETQCKASAIKFKDIPDKFPGMDYDK
jgi:hypothetical protein